MELRPNFWIWFEGPPNFLCWNLGVQEFITIYVKRDFFLFFLVGIFGIIETMVDTKRFWVETFPPLVKKLSHFMLRKNPITEIKGQKVH